MQINEIFYSIQGEGKWSGYPNIFVRTGGCNLKCSYCDTKYAQNNYKNLEIPNILNIVKGFKCNRVCITGGEPLIQQDIVILVDNLIKNQYKITIETNGSIDIKPFIKTKSLMISLDIKCPSSNMSNEMNFSNLLKLKEKDQLKFIINNKEDFEYAKNIIKKYKINCPIFFQPVSNMMPEKIASWILEDDLNVRLGLQIHKIIWKNQKGK